MRWSMSQQRGGKPNGRINRGPTAMLRATFRDWSLLQRLLCGKRERVRSPPRTRLVYPTGTIHAAVCECSACMLLPAFPRVCTWNDEEGDAPVGIQLTQAGGGNQSHSCRFGRGAVTAASDSTVQVDGGVLVEGSKHLMSMVQPAAAAVLQPSALAATSGGASSAGLRTVSVADAQRVAGEAPYARVLRFRLLKGSSDARYRAG